MSGVREDRGRAEGGVQAEDAGGSLQSSVAQEGTPYLRLLFPVTWD